MTRVRAALVTIALLAVAGCASGAGGTAPTGSQAAAGSSTSVDGGASQGQATPPVGQVLDACSLLTDAEILQVTGSAVVSKEPGDPTGVLGDGCDWKLDIGSEIVAPEVALGVMSSGGRAYFDTYFLPYATEPVSGLGDEAIRDDATSLMAVKGDVLVSVQVVGKRTNEFPRQLIEVIFSKLP
jgi:hypothetical protein